MTRYVIGFMFDPTRQAVVLIRKQRPTWMQGFLNGVGGKIEAGETPLEAMQREFREETGLDIPVAEWDYVGVMWGESAEVFIYRSVGDPWKAKTTTDERVEVHYLSLLDRNEAVPNLRWLLPFCADESPRNVNVRF